MLLGSITLNENQVYNAPILTLFLLYASKLNDFFFVSEEKAGLHQQKKEDVYRNHMDTSPTHLHTHTYTHLFLTQTFKGFVCCCWPRRDGVELSWFQTNKESNIVQQKFQPKSNGTPIFLSRRQINFENRFAATFFFRRQYFCNQYHLIKLSEAQRMKKKKILNCYFLLRRNECFFSFEINSEKALKWNS